MQDAATLYSKVIGLSSVAYDCNSLDNYFQIYKPPVVDSGAGRETIVKTGLGGTLYAIQMNPKLFIADLK